MDEKLKRMMAVTLSSRTSILSYDFNGVVHDVLYFHCIAVLPDHHLFHVLESVRVRRCLVAELLIGPGLIAGKTEQHQLELTFDLLGAPQGEALRKLSACPDWEKMKFLAEKARARSQLKEFLAGYAAIIFGWRI